LTDVEIVGDEQKEDLVNRESLINLNVEPAEESSKISATAIIILISTAGVIALGICIICLVLKKKRISLNNGGSKPSSKKEEEDKKKVDKFLLASLEKKKFETQKKFFGDEITFNGGMDT
jgi:hypothetical protein